MKRNSKLRRIKEITFALCLSLALPVSAEIQSTGTPTYSRYGKIGMQSTSMMTDKGYGVYRQHNVGTINPNMRTVPVAGSEYYGARRIGNTSLHITSGSTMQSYGGGTEMEMSGRTGWTGWTGLTGQTDLSDLSSLSSLDSPIAQDYPTSLTKNNAPPSAHSQWDQWWAEFLATNSPKTESALRLWWFRKYGGGLNPNDFLEFLNYVRGWLTDEDPMPIADGLWLMLLLAMAWIIYKRKINTKLINMRKHIILFALLLSIMPCRVQGQESGIPEIPGMDPSMVEMLMNLQYVLAPIADDDPLWETDPEYALIESLIQMVNGAEKYVLDDDKYKSSIFDEDGRPIMDAALILDKHIDSYDGKEHSRYLIFLKYQNVYLQLTNYSGYADESNVPLDIATLNVMARGLGLDYSNPIKMYVHGEVDNAATWTIVQSEFNYLGGEGFINITADESVYEAMGMSANAFTPALVLDLYMEDVKIKCADKNSWNVSNLGNLLDPEFLGSLGNLPGMACPIAFCTAAKDLGAATLNIHIKGDNRLVGGRVNFNALNILQLVSSPIALRSLNRGIDEVGATAGRINFDDLWLSDAQGTAYHTNGVLDFDVEEDNNVSKDNKNLCYGTPAIDLGFPYGQCQFDGGQYIFHAPANNNLFFVNSMSICYKQFSFFGINGFGIGSSVGTTDSAVPWSVNIQSGTFTTHSADRYKDDFVDVVSRGWYNDYTDLRLPLNSIIGKDATFNNGKVYLCDAAGEVGLEPTRTEDNKTIALCRKQTEVPEDEIDPQTGLWQGTLMTPIEESDGKYYVYQYVDASHCEDEPEEERAYVHNWVTVIPRMGLVIAGEENPETGTTTKDVEVLTMGGDVEVRNITSDEKHEQTNSFLFYAQLNEYTKQNATVNLQIFSPTVQDALDLAAGSAGIHEFSDVINPTSYQIEHGIYTMLSFEPNQWHTICPPFDIHNVYVIETYGTYEGNSTDEYGYNEYLNEQGFRDGELAQTIVTSLCPDILSKKGSGVNYNLLEIAEKQLGLKLNQETKVIVKNSREKEEEISKGIYSLKHYNPILAETDESYSAEYANYFLYERTETYNVFGSDTYWNVSNDGDISTYWTPVTPIAPTEEQKYIDRLGNEITHNILMQKGHVYSFYLPETDDAPYWKGKYLVFEGYGPQILDGKQEHEKSVSMDKLLTDESNYQWISDNLGYTEEEILDHIAGLPEGKEKQEFLEILELKRRNLTTAAYISFIGNHTFGNDTIGNARSPYKTKDNLWEVARNENGVLVFKEENRSFYRPFDTWVVARKDAIDQASANMGKEPLTLPKLGPASPENVSDLEHLPHINDITLRAWQQNGISIVSYDNNYVEVYSVSGMKIWGSQMTDGDYKHIAVPSGLYVIKTENQAVKLWVE